MSSSCHLVSFNVLSSGDFSLVSCSNEISEAVNIRTNADKSELNGFSFDFERRNEPDLLADTTTIIMYYGIELYFYIGKFIALSSWSLRILVLSSSTELRPIKMKCHVPIIIQK